MPLKRKKDYFKETLKDYFALSTPERRGLFALFLLMLCLILTKFAIDYWPQSNEPTDFAAFDKEVTAFLAAQQSATDSSRTDGNRHPILAQQLPEKKQAALFTFNPNGLAASDWKRLGFSDQQIKVIKHYEEKGGRFYTKEDVKKMYAISEREYLRIEPYISIPPTGYARHKTPSSYDDLKIDIGVADTVELKKLRGIGSVYARRIVRYREKLGGFCSILQVKEVWGMSDSLLYEIQPHIYLSDSMHVSRINLNTATLDDLKAHPYISYNLARLFVNYRQQHGDFKQLADIHQLPLVNDELYRKIVPYLKVE